MMLVACIGFLAGSAAQAQEPLNIGSRLEPIVDRYLVDSMDGTSLMLHHPRPAETVLAFDEPWEGRFCGYVTILHVDRLYHLYYRGRPNAGKDGTDDEVTCYAVSVDGTHFTKPDLGIHEVYGTRDNNVILAGIAPLSHNFSPLYDPRPECPPEERFKGLAGTSKTGLIGFVSPDGIHWRKLREEPLVTGGAFDSQNLAFWSETEKCFVCYFRIFTDGIRSVSRCTSPDFVNWSKSVEMTYGGTPREHLYTNQTTAYYRAPHIYVSIAARFMPGRRVISAEQMKAMGGDAGYSGDCSDAVFFTTRGGNAYDRTFMEGFIRPGVGYENWTSRTNYPVYGLLPFGDSEMSVYIQRNYGQDTAHLQRFTLRADGFASVHAPYAGGEMVTKPLVFAGKELVINYSTSAAGSVWVEVQDAAGVAVPGFAQANCDEIIGDHIARTVTWKGNADLSALAGKPIRLRFVMNDADLYSVQFN
ncbi:MAG: hypothetical protein GY851_26060 [bacterium]|nr:hypothetical protein [bacterium]